jgi:hypothetical protein
MNISVSLGPYGRVTQNQEIVNPQAADYSEQGGAGTTLNPHFNATPETGLSGTWRWLGRQWYNPSAGQPVNVVGPAVKIA